MCFCFDAFKALDVGINTSDVMRNMRTTNPSLFISHVQSTMGPVVSNSLMDASLGLIHTKTKINAKFSFMHYKTSRLKSVKSILWKFTQ